ncbi:DUF3304 domain-containing protein [Pseudoduganella sp. RAF53_2]
MFFIPLAGCLLMREPDPVLVSVDAVHYFPSEYRVDEFYIDHHYFGSSSFDGIAGSGLCCIAIPERWRPGLTVDVSWSVTDWTLTPIDDKAHFDAKKIRVVGLYRADVPVEKYEEADDLFVHFFEGGLIRVSPGIQRFDGPYASTSDIAAAAKFATKGRHVTELITKEDRAAIDKEVEEHRKKYGDWR